MAIDLKTHEAKLLAAWNDVMNEKSSTDWALFGYDGHSNTLKVVSTGDSGLVELSEDLNSNKIMYGFCRLLDPKTELPKYVLINWVSGTGGYSDLHNGIYQLICPPGCSGDLDTPPACERANPMDLHL